LIEPSVFCQIAEGYVRQLPDLGASEWELRNFSDKMPSSAGTKHAIPPESIWKTVNASINVGCLRHLVVGKHKHF
jgi:hypothetical protein